MDDTDGGVTPMDASQCTTMCNGACADTRTDNANCGKCGNACPMGASCVQGSCQCGMGQTRCGNACVDLKVDNANCGKCGAACGAGDAGMIMGGGMWGCTSGTCSVVCPMGKTNCDPDGCVDTQTDNNHCGMCGTACMMNEQCMQGLCCGQGQSVCNNTCTDTKNDANNCGMCGMKCPMNQPNCSGGKCTTLIAALVCASSSYKADVQSGLQALNAFTKVDLMDCGSSTPTLMQLQAYDAVLVFSDSGFQNPSTLGDNLAQYWNGGGTVVVATFGNTSSLAVTGQWGNQNNGYIFIAPAAQEQPNESAAIKINEAMSPLVANVNKLTATSAYRSSGGVINNGTVVAQWGSGKPLIVRGVKSNRNIAELNFYPPSSKIRNDFWVGDGFQIIRNALYFK